MALIYGPELRHASSPKYRCDKHERALHKMVIGTMWTRIRFRGIDRERQKTAPTRSGHGESLQEEIRACAECARAREKQEAIDRKIAENERRQEEYEEERARQNTLANRVLCLLAGGHSYELIGFFAEETEVNAGSWSINTETRIKDCKNCGKRKFEFLR